MEQFIFTDIPLKITNDELLKKLHLGQDCGQADLIYLLLHEALTVACPKAFLCASPVKLLSDSAVSVGGEKIESAFVRRMLEGQGVVFPFVVTCGEELDRWSVLKTEPFESYICDCIKDLALDQCFLYARKSLSSYVPQEMYLSCLNPGSLPLWQLREGQKTLFRLLLDVTSEIGVRLTDSFLMSPVKSISGIFFVAKEPYQNCMLCRRSCPERMAPLNLQMANEFNI